MSERYQNCPMCGSICRIGGDDKEGTHYYVPVSDNAKLQAENDELRAFVNAFISWCENRTEACAFEDDEIALSRVLDEARALLRGESEEK